jgi:hypothetical protein
MKTDQLGMQWLEPLILQAFEEYRSQQVQIETMLEEGIVLRFLFFEKCDVQRDAVLFESCFMDDPENGKWPSRPVPNPGPDDDLEE